MMKKGARRAAPAGDGETAATVKSVKKTARARTAPRKTPDEVRVDYPQNAEIVLSPYYTYRISVTTPEAAKVALSINGGDWLACRESLGFWWFDWQGYKPGAHVATARADKKNGRFAISAPRRFKVKI
ncbi:MAG: hypothetical protein KGL04_10175 [Elusimicrobia bacterium]|nr:hypothetical protein [Elusimicrobiota bacterium]